MPADVQKQAQETEQQKIMCYTGFRFEQVTTWPSRTPPTPQEEQQRNAEPLNNFESFCSVASTKFGRHKILFGAEVDCAGKR